MKYKHFLGVLISVLLLNLLLSSCVLASWVAFTPQQLIQNSDVILVGQISGSVGEKLGIFERFKTSGYTLWKVNVRYYLKGDQNSSEFIVATPGARSSSIQSSNDYKLDEWGNTVLLFLRKSENIYEPITPSGIVTLNSLSYHRQPDEQINGHLILKEFTIMDEKISQQEQTELEQYIAGNNLVVLPSTAVQMSESNLKRSNSIIIVTFLLLVFVIILFKNRLSK